MGSTGSGAVVRSELSADHATLTLHVRGHLDVAAGQALLDAVRTAVIRHPRRLEIDLQWLERFTPEGIAALRACRNYVRRFPGGLHIRTKGQAAREAYLIAFA